jgi:hypothetical protein
MFVFMAILLVDGVDTKHPASAVPARRLLNCGHELDFANPIEKGTPMNINETSSPTTDGALTEQDLVEVAGGIIPVGLVRTVGKLISDIIRAFQQPTT